jgi:hypothetical protein
MAKSGGSRFRRIGLAVGVLGAVLFNYPFLMIFDRPTHVLGLPLLPLYFTVLWAISILITYAYCRSLGRPVAEEEER